MIIVEDFELVLPYPCTRVVYNEIGTQKAEIKYARHFTFNKRLRRYRLFFYASLHFFPHTMISPLHHHILIENDKETNNTIANPPLASSSSLRITTRFDGPIAAVGCRRLGCDVMKWKIDSETKGVPYCYDRSKFKFVLPCYCCCTIQSHQVPMIATNSSSTGNFPIWA